MKYNDEDIAKRLGLEMVDSEAAEQLLGEFYKTLDIRVGAVVAGRLNEEQLTRFESLRESGEDDETVEDWLRAAIPGYETLLDEEAEKLLAEIDQNAENMLS